MASMNGVADPDTESDNEKPTDLSAKPKKQKWQSLFSTAKWDNGRLTLQISNIEEHHHQHRFRIPKSLAIHRSVPDLCVKTKPAFAGIDTPRLNVVIQIVGSRGDVQPYVAFGKVLQQPPYNHRVRLATHPNFKDFVEENGLEFFSIGGDPEALMSYMIKNPGIFPGKESIKAGEPSLRRAEIAQMLEGCWRSCVERGDGMDKAPGKNKDGTPASPPTTKPKHNDPFVADAIIANPPSYAHIHCAEKLSIPLQLSFTMPWSPTQAFPHPLANITPTDESKTVTNYASFIITETLTWQGLGDLFNRFRTKTLGLDPINPLLGATIISRLRVPWTYCWSKALIPKPADWGPNIGISGFYFLELASTYKPSAELQAFLDAGPPPVYIGFGSIPLRKPEEAMAMILAAVAKLGVRALVSKGWGGLQCDDPPPGVFMLDSVPHDWLFPRVSCVVHHGGAGTTAIGIKLGKPTVVIPFFGDQPFWGGMVYRAGAGPKPVPFKKLTTEKLVECLEMALRPESLAKAKKLGERVRDEVGTQTGAQMFMDSLDIDAMRCDLLPERVATWRIKRTEVKLSMPAAAVLVTTGTVDARNLEECKHQEWVTDQGPMAPLGGVFAAVVDNATNAGMGIHRFNKAMRQLHKESQEAKKRPSSAATSTDNVARLSEGDATENYLKNIQDELFEPDSHSSSSSTAAPPNGTTTFSQSDDRSTIPSFTKNAKAVFNPKPLPEKPLSDLLRLHITRRRGGVYPGSPRHSNSASSSTASSSSTPISSPNTPKPPTPHHHHPHLHTITHEAISAANTVISAGLSTPIDVAYNLALGFRNAPILFFGDATVRPPPRITGLKTGAQAAAAELLLGLYDAVSGVVLQPRNAVRDDGWRRGLPRGVASGVGGLLMKSTGAVLGVPGFLAKGVHRQLRRPGAREADRRVLEQRRLMGLEALRLAGPEVQRDILARWEELVRRDEERAEREEKAAGEHGFGLGVKKGKHGLRYCERASSVPLRSLPLNSRHYHQHHRRKDLAATLEGAGDKDLDEAVKKAVRLTSEGDEKQDARIREAVRASLMELREGVRAGREEKKGGREGSRSVGGGDGAAESAGGVGAIGADVEDDERDENATHSLQYEVWKRICEAHMGIAPQSQLGVAVSGA